MPESFRRHMSIRNEAKKRWLKAVGSTLWYAAEHGLYNGITVSEESRENTFRLKKHLDNGGSGLVITNHIAADDIVLQLEYLVKHLGISINELTAPVSKKQFDGREGWFNAIILRMTPYIGINRPLIVQSYDTASYDQELVAGLRDEAFTEMNDTLLKPGGLVEFAPEGRRSRNKTLGRGRSGLGHVVLNYLTDVRTQLGMGPEAVLTPAALVPNGRYSRKLNLRFSNEPFDGFEIRIGQPLPLNAINPQALPHDIAQGCMHYLSSMMPDDMRGKYTV